MTVNPKICWAPPLRPSLLKRLYDSDAAGFQDLEICDEVGITLFVRCRTFALVSQNQVECPVCGTVFQVASAGDTCCPGNACEWQTTQSEYRQSIRNYNAHTGRALEAYLTFYHQYPNARTYKQKILLIDQLIHSFHIHEKTGDAVKSVASKLLEGNKKAVVRFLEDLSAVDSQNKDAWRRTVAETIDSGIVKHNNTDAQ